MSAESTEPKTDLQRWSNSTSLSYLEIVKDVTKEILH